MWIPEVWANWTYSAMQPPQIGGGAALSQREAMGMKADGDHAEGEHEELDRRTGSFGNLGNKPKGFEPHNLSAFLCLAPSGFPVPGLSERRHAAPLRALDSPHTIRYVGRTDRRSRCLRTGPGLDDFRMLASSGSIGGGWLFLPRTACGRQGWSRERQQKNEGQLASDQWVRERDRVALGIGNDQRLIAQMG